MGFKIRIFDQVIQFGYEIFVRRGYGIQIINSKNISFLNWKQEMQIVFAMFLVLYMWFDRFLLAVESRDLSQADKSIKVKTL